MANSRLVILTGPLEGKAFPLDEPVTIGRGVENIICFEDLQVSRKHAVVEAGSKGCLLKDLGSGNGTFVGNRRVLEYKLAPNDIVRIGTQQLRYESDVHATPEHDDSSGVRFKSEASGRVEAADAEDIYATFFQAPAKEATAEELRQTQERLQAVYAANQIMSSERDLGKLFANVMDHIFALIPAHHGVILLRDRHNGELITEYVKTDEEKHEITISSSIVRRASENREAVITYDAADDSRFDANQSIISHNISSAMCVPLLYQKEVLGVIYVDTRGTANAFVSTDLELLVALAGPAAIAIRNAQYVQELEQAFEDTLTVLASAIELRDHYTVGHTWRVTNFSIEIARELKWSEEKIKEVQMGGVLHDVGKIAVEDAVLRKPDKLTDEEFAKIKIHPERGAQLLEDVERLHALIPYCLYHHERFDGKGYPFGLSGEEIPLEGRLVAVADTFDALTSNRPYRKGFDPEKAIGIIEECKGTQFDPACADALIRAYRAGKIDRILQDYYKKDERSIACPFCSTFIRLPEQSEPGSEFGCNVCHRGVRLVLQNGAWFGELLPQSSMRRTTKFSRHGIQLETPGPPEA